MYRIGRFDFTFPPFRTTQCKQFDLEIGQGLLYPSIVVLENGRIRKYWSKLRNIGDFQLMGLLKKRKNVIEFIICMYGIKIRT